MAREKRNEQARQLGKDVGRGHSGHSGDGGRDCDEPRVENFTGMRNGDGGEVDR